LTEQLQRNLSPGFGIFRQIHLAHPSGAQRAEQAVLAKVPLTVLVVRFRVDSFRWVVRRKIHVVLSRQCETKCWRMEMLDPISNPTMDKRPVLMFD